MQSRLLYGGSIIFGIGTVVFFSTGPHQNAIPPAILAIATLIGGSVYRVRWRRDASQGNAQPASCLDLGETAKSSFRERSYYSDS
jgi:hypothetical protein